MNYYSPIQAKHSSLNFKISSKNRLFAPDEPIPSSQLRYWKHRDCIQNRSESEAFRHTRQFHVQYMIDRIHENDRI